MGPHTQKLEMVQCRAARYVYNRWHNTSSVTGMLSQLEWAPLARRRANIRMCMMYRVAHTPVSDPWTPCLTFVQRTTQGAPCMCMQILFLTTQNISDIRAAHHSGGPMHGYISTRHDACKFSFLPHRIIASASTINPSTQLAVVQRTHNRTVHYSTPHLHYI